MSSRVLGNARALASSGYDVHIVGRSSTPSDACFSEEYKDIRYTLIDLIGPTTIPKWRRAASFIAAGYKARNWLSTHMSDDCAGVILYGGYSRYLSFLISFLREKKVPLIVDMADWIEPSHCWGGALGPQRLDIEYTFRTLIPKAGNVIVVSKFLSEFFQKRHLHSMIVPPLVDMQETKWKTYSDKLDNSDTLRLAYIGNAGKKDCLANIIRALFMLRPKLDKLKFDIVGPTKSELASSLMKDQFMLEALKEYIRITGRLPHDEALAYLRASDFTVLVRPDARYSKAGFPTKIVESFAMGIPVIANITGDIGLFLTDGEEGIIVPDESPLAIAEGIAQAMNLERECLQNMGKRARQRALNCFDFRNWISPLDDFIKSCSND